VGERRITLAGSPVNGVRRLIPALLTNTDTGLTNTDTGPIRRGTVAATPSHATRSMMSRLNASAVPPAARIAMLNAADAVGQTHAHREEA
jgi:hypothetical protein